MSKRSCQASAGLPESIWALVGYYDDGSGVPDVYAIYDKKENANVWRQIMERGGCSKRVVVVEVGFSCLPSEFKESKP